MADTRSDSVFNVKLGLFRNNEEKAERFITLFNILNTAQDIKIKEKAFSAIKELCADFQIDEKCKEEMKTKCETSFKNELHRLRDAKIDIWADLWIFCVETFGSGLTGSKELANSLLSVVEHALKGNKDSDTVTLAFKCWMTLIDNFALNLIKFSGLGRISLLMTPLICKNLRRDESSLNAKLNAFWHLIVKVGPYIHIHFKIIVLPFLDFCFGSKNRSEKSVKPKLYVLVPKLATDLLQMFYVILCDDLANRKILCKDNLKIELPDDLLVTSSEEFFTFYGDAINIVFVFIKSMPDNPYTLASFCALLRRIKNLNKFNENAWLAAIFQVLNSLQCIFQNVEEKEQEQTLETINNLCDALFNNWSSNEFEATMPHLFGTTRSIVLDLLLKQMPAMLLANKNNVGKAEERYIKLIGKLMEHADSIVSGPNHCSDLKNVIEALENLFTQTEYTSINGQCLLTKLLSVWDQFGKIVHRVLPSESANENCDELSKKYLLQLMLLPIKWLMNRDSETLKIIISFDNLLSSWKQLLQKYVDVSSLSLSINKKHPFDEVGEEIELLLHERNYYTSTIIGLVHICYCFNSVRQNSVHKNLTESLIDLKILHKTAEMIQKCEAIHPIKAVKVLAKALQFLSVTETGIEQLADLFKVFHVLLMTVIPNMTDENLADIWQTYAHKFQSSLLKLSPGSFHLKLKVSCKEILSGIVNLKLHKNIKVQQGAIQLEIAINEYLHKSRRSCESNKPDEAKTEKPRNVHSPSQSMLSSLKRVRKSILNSPIQSPSNSPVINKPALEEQDSQDFVMIPPKQKAKKVLTPHQKESKRRRRDDIPALYQGLSQDTFNSDTLDTQDSQLDVPTRCTAVSSPFISEDAVDIDILHPIQAEQQNTVLANEQVDDDIVFIKETLSPKKMNEQLKTSSQDEIIENSQANPVVIVEEPAEIEESPAWVIISRSRPRNRQGVLLPSKSLRNLEQENKEKTTPFRPSVCRAAHMVQLVNKDLKQDRSAVEETSEKGIQKKNLKNESVNKSLEAKAKPEVEITIIRTPVETTVIKSNNESPSKVNSPKKQYQDDELKKTISHVENSQELNTVEISLSQATASKPVCVIPETYEEDTANVHSTPDKSVSQPNEVSPNKDSPVPDISTAPSTIRKSSLKRPMTEICDVANGTESPSPNRKKSKVSFSEPLVTGQLESPKCLSEESIYQSLYRNNSPKSFQKKRETKVSRKLLQYSTNIRASTATAEVITLSNTETIVSQGSLRSEAPGDLDAPVFPPLINCTDSVDNIVSKLCSPMLAEALINNLRSLNIHSIGDLCGLKEINVSALEIKEPKVENLKVVLSEYMAEKEQENDVKLIPIQDYCSEASLPIIEEPQETESGSLTKQLQKLVKENSLQDVVKALGCREEILECLSSIDTEVKNNGANIFETVLKVNDRSQFMEFVSSNITDDELKTISTARGCRLINTSSVNQESERVYDKCNTGGLVENINEGKVAELVNEMLRKQGPKHVLQVFTTNNLLHVVNNEEILAYIVKNMKRKDIVTELSKNLTIPQLLRFVGRKDEVLKHLVTKTPLQHLVGQCISKHSTKAVLRSIRNDQDITDYVLANSDLTKLLKAVSSKLQQSEVIETLGADNLLKSIITKLPYEKVLSEVKNKIPMSEIVQSVIVDKNITDLLISHNDPVQIVKKSLAVLKAGELPKVIDGIELDQQDEIFAALSLTTVQKNIEKIMNCGINSERKEFIINTVLSKLNNNELVTEYLRRLNADEVDYDFIDKLVTSIPSISLNQVLQSANKNLTPKINISQLINKLEGNCIVQLCNELETKVAQTIIVQLLNNPEKATELKHSILDLCENNELILYVHSQCKDQEEVAKVIDYFAGHLPAYKLLQIVEKKIETDTPSKRSATFLKDFLNKHSSNEILIGNLTERNLSEHEIREVLDHIVTFTNIKDIMDRFPITDLIEFYNNLLQTPECRGSLLRKSFESVDKNDFFRFMKCETLLYIISKELDKENGELTPEMIVSLLSEESVNKLFIDNLTSMKNDEINSEILEKHLSKELLARVVSDIILKK